MKRLLFVIPLFAVVALAFAQPASLLPQAATPDEFSRVRIVVGGDFMQHEPQGVR